MKDRSRILNIAHFCNNDCRFCYNSGSRNISPKLGFQQIKDEIRDAKSKKIKKIVLFGGEPTIHPDFFEIMDEIRKSCFCG